MVFLTKLEGRWTIEDVGQKCSKIRGKGLPPIGGGESNKLIVSSKEESGVPGQFSQAVKARWCKGEE